MIRSTASVGYRYLLPLAVAFLVVALGGQGLALKHNGNLALSLCRQAYKTGKGQWSA